MWSRSLFPKAWQKKGEGTRDFFLGPRQVRKTAEEVVSSLNKITRQDDGASECQVRFHSMMITYFELRGRRGHQGFRRGGVSSTEFRFKLQRSTGCREGVSGKVSQLE